MDPPICRVTEPRRTHFSDIRTWHPAILHFNKIQFLAIFVLTVDIHFTRKQTEPAPYSLHMSEAVNLSRVPPIGVLPSPTSIASSSSLFPSLARRNRSLPSLRGAVSLSGKFPGSNHFPAESQLPGRKLGIFNVWSGEGSVQELDDAPVSVELEPICSETQFDRVIAEAQQLDEGVVIVWTAKWCRKCIYLEPKLKRLAADYHPRLRFYRVDVNNVPHRLVARAGVTKMPTIQLWKDAVKQGEVIGGHKAYLVVNEVRDLIENNDGDI